MALRVFTPSQARSVAEERTAKDAARAKELADITEDLLKETAEAERIFQETLKRDQQEFERQYEENIYKKQELEKEVLELEKRRRNALSPLLIKEEDIHSIQEALTARELFIAQKEAENEENTRLLMRKLDEVSSQKQELDSREKRVRQMEQGAEFQRNQIAGDSRRLSLQMAGFQKKIEEKETEFAYRQSELDAQKNLYDENDKKLIEREKEIEAGKRLLADQRLLLEKGFEELRRKQYGK